MLELLYEAVAASPGEGIGVETTDPKSLRAKLYPLIKKEKLPLSLTVVADEVWILRKEIQREQD